MSVLFSLILTFGILKTPRFFLTSFKLDSWLILNQVETLKSFLYPFSYILSKRMDPIFFHLAIILAIAFVVASIVKAFKQPIIIGYIIAGVIVSPFLIKYGISTELIGVFSQFGIAFLLFIVGLHLNPKVIKEIGTASLLVGIGQMILTFILGFLVGFFILGFPTIASVYVGLALAFSSTIIIMKLLSDKRQLDSLYGKISIGILIIQDLVAIAALIFISSSVGNVAFEGFAFKGLFSGLGLIVLLFLLGYLVLPRVTKYIAKSQEILFLFSITWCFVIAGLFNYLGFSLEIGALIAGIVLSISPYSVEISAKIRPLRDFFLIIFFVILGLGVQLSSIGSILVNAIILSVIALILKPIIIMIFMRFFGYTKRTNFLVGTTLAQISEFSLIIGTLGVAVGHIAPEILQTITLSGIITIGLSAYMIIYAQGFYEKLRKVLCVFEKKRVKTEKKVEKKYDAILFGYNRIGFGILNSLKKIKKKYLVVDFNPDTVADLEKMRIPVLYGDAYDMELLEDLPLDKVELVVSTIPDDETNILLIENVRAMNKKAIIIVRAHSIDQAMEFYKKGASYVLTPHFLGGEYVAKMIKSLKVNSKGYDEERNKHMKMLLDRFKRGQDHPEVEKN